MTEVAGSGAVSSSWAGLVAGIREAFSSDKVDVEAVKNILSSYTSRREDWEPYAKFDTHK